MGAEATKARHLILVGIRGSGKSTLGRMLAEQTGRDFLDTDDLVVERLGTSIRETFERLGEAAFRSAERDVVQSLEERQDPCVVATGGGVVLDSANRKQLRRLGLVVWLDIPAHRAACRIDGSDRPSLTGKPPTEELEQIAGERRHLYEAAAHITLDATLPAQALVRRLERLWMKG